MTNHELKKEWSLAEAQQEFQSLVESRRPTALWFADPARSFDVTHPQSLLILDSIARNCDRVTWLLVRKLKAWRLQHFK